MTREDYNKANRKVLITFIIAVITMVLFTTALVANAFNSRELYTMKGIVTEVDTTNRLTTFTDTNGESWRFRGIKNWTIGDNIELIVHSNNTEDFHDDKVIGANKINNFKKGFN